MTIATLPMAFLGCFVASWVHTACQLPFHRKCLAFSFWS